MVTALKPLCEKYQISVRRLSAICGGAKSKVSATSAHRLINGTADDTYLTKVWAHVAVCVALYLAARGVADEEIKSEIRAAFPDINPQTNGAQSATVILRDGTGHVIHVHEMTIAI